MKLLIATPFYEVKAWSPYVTSLMKTAALLHAMGIEYDFWAVSGDSYVDRVRNDIANTFMASDYSHMLFIDSDHEWDLEGFGRVLKADADIVGAGYPCKNIWEFYSVILQTEHDGMPIVREDGLVKAWGVPTGFMKIKREVFIRLAEKMEASGRQPDDYYFTYDHKSNKQNKVYNFFGRIPPMGEDISFCHRWRTMCGGELWVEPRVQMTHWGVKGWSGSFHDVLTRFPGGSRPSKEEELIQKYLRPDPTITVNRDDAKFPISPRDFKAAIEEARKCE